MSISCFRISTRCLDFKEAEYESGSDDGIYNRGSDPGISLKSRNPEYSTFISVAVCIVLLFVCVSRMRVMLSGIRTLTDKIRMDSTYLVILVKLIGIAYICEFAASISKDAGYSAVASQIELLGKLPMGVVSLQFCMHVVQSVLSLID